MTPDQCMRSSGPATGLDRGGSGWALGAGETMGKWVKDDHSSRPPSTQIRGATCCDGGDSGGASAVGGLCVEKSDDDGDRNGPRRPQSAFKALGNSVCAGVQVPRLVRFSTPKLHSILGRRLNGALVLKLEPCSRGPSWP